MKRYQALAGLVTLYALFVVVVGAWVRLTDAGLGCPDWPGCFGQLDAPQTTLEVERARSLYPEVQVEQGKAWNEMFHRFVAGGLGIAVLLLAVEAWRRRRRPGQRLGLPLALVGLVIFQALLGKWTVTLQLKPLIVAGHLLGGLTLLAGLFWLTLTSGARERVRGRPPRAALALLVLALLVGQIALGGWTSTNYAALACPDFPTCQDQWLPEADFAEAFVPWRGIGQNYEGGVLMHPARVAIHFTHRVGAIVLTAALLLLGALCWRRGDRSQRRAALLMTLALGLQLGIGIAIVLYSLPLWLGVAHNGNAALLLLSVLYLNYAIRHPATSEDHAADPAIERAAFQH